MATNHTEHYQLSQWAAEDSFLREEFNEDFRKIDGVLAEKSGIVAGSYGGDGAAERLISLGFTPKAVLVVREDGRANTNNFGYGGLALPGLPAQIKTTSGKQYPVVTITEGGFLVYWTSVSQSYYMESNDSSHVYYYLALR